MIKVIKIVEESPICKEEFTPFAHTSGRCEVLIASEDLTKFIRVTPGEYRYANHAQAPTKRSSGSRQAVKELKDKKPQMTKVEVLNTLRRTGFDFQGKNPSRVVNMAWVNLGYGRKEKQLSL